MLLALLGDVCQETYNMLLALLRQIKNGLEFNLIYNIYNLRYLMNGPPTEDQL